MDWIIAHWGILGTVIGAVWGLWKHRQAGAVTDALGSVIKGVESTDSASLKTTIKGIAESDGTQALLHSIVQSVTKGGAA